MTTLDAGELRQLDPDIETWALEFPDSLSQSAVVSIYRQLQEMLPDKRVVIVQDGGRFRPLSSLDAAWAEAEAALPEGWRFLELSPASVEDVDDPAMQGWTVLWWAAATEAPLNAVGGWADTIDEEDPNHPAFEMAKGPTPAAALCALAKALRKPVPA